MDTWPDFYLTMSILGALALAGLAITFIVNYFDI